jgi:hypothetical protein
MLKAITNEHIPAAGFFLVDPLSNFGRGENGCAILRVIHNRAGLRPAEKIVRIQNQA